MIASPRVRGGGAVARELLQGEQREARREGARPSHETDRDRDVDDDEEGVTRGGRVARRTRERSDVHAGDDEMHARGEQAKETRHLAGS